MILRCACGLLRARPPGPAPVRTAVTSKTSTAAGSSIMGLGKGKKKGKAGAGAEKRVLPAETDAHRLVSSVCGSNIYTSGEDVQLQPDSEYPAWVWTLRLGAPAPLQQLSPDSKEYWLRVRRAAMRRNNMLKQIKPF